MLCSNTLRRESRSPRTARLKIPNNALMISNVVRLGGSRVKQTISLFAAIGACAALVLGSAAPADAQGTRNPISTAAIFGFDVGPSAETGYAGAIYALNGDSSRDGFLIRGLGVYSSYDYDAAVGAVDGDMVLFDGMVGYQIMRSNIRVAGFVGVEYQDHDLSPNDPANSVNGDETGFKAVGEVTLGHGNALFINLIGAYSTAFETHWVRFRPGYNYERFTFGPEIIWQGNESYDAHRVGGYLTMRLPDTPFDVTVSSGYHKNEDSGIFGDDNGAYGSINIGVVF
jgi:hypothetical protein